MSDEIPSPPWLEPDYYAELDRARLAYAVYFERAEVEAAFQGTGDSVLGGHQMPDKSWRLPRDPDDFFLDRSDTSGLVAATFVNDRDQKILIAYRGRDDARDAPAATALNNDGDWWNQQGLPFGPKTEHTQRQAGQIRTLWREDVLGHDSWDPQFADALDYAKHIRDKYEPLGYTIEVAGHDIGGAHAQLVAHTFGLRGRAFDALGAQNIAESAGYKQWLADHGMQRPVGIPGYDRGEPREDNFLTYRTRYHEPSHTTGAHLGRTRTVSALAGREGVGEYATYALSTAEAAASEVPVVGEVGYGKALKAGRAGAEAAKDVVQHQAAQGLDAPVRGSMARMVRVFEIAAQKSELPTFGQDGPGPVQDAPQRAPGQNAADAATQQARMVQHQAAEHRQAADQAREQAQAAPAATIPRPASAPVPAHLQDFPEFPGHTATPQTQANVPALPANFAPPLGAVTDLRDPNHPGHDAFARTLNEVHYAETTRGIAHGPHSERVAAALMLEAVRNGQGITKVEIEPNGRIVGLERGSMMEPAKQVSIDSNHALSMSMEQYATQWAQLRSPHYTHSQPAAERTPEQIHALGQLSPQDQAMFAKIREGVPPHIADDVVASAMLQAKKDGIRSAEQIDRVAMAGDNLWIAGTTPGFRVAVDVSSPPPPLLQETAQHANRFNQEQQLALETGQREQQQPQGRGFAV